LIFWIFLKFTQHQLKIARGCVFVPFCRRRFNKNTAIFREQDISYIRAVGVQISPNYRPTIYSEKRCAPWLYAVLAANHGRANVL